MGGLVPSVVALVALVAASAECLSDPPDVEWDASLWDARPIDAEVVLDPAMLATSQGPAAFGDVTVGEMSNVLAVVVRNVGEQASGAVNVALSGTNPDDFAIVSTGGADDCFGAILEPQGTCIAQVRFAPAAAEAARRRAWTCRPRRAVRSRSP